MLQTQTVDAPTLDLIKRLQSLELLKGYRLVGGTSLALQLGHRKSVDIDLFGSKNVLGDELLEAFKSIGQVHIIQQQGAIGIFSIEDIKVDLVCYSYEWLKPGIEESGILLADIEDIAAMKLSAAAGRGTKKDFFDISFLLDQFSMTELLDLYLKKYPEGSKFMVLKSLSYFKDAEEDKDPVMLIPRSWSEVKKSISRELRPFLGLI